MSHLLHQLLESSAQQYRERSAFICQNKAITYGELDKVSSQLAWVLKDAGISKGARVGIYLSKSIEAVVSIFGILKTGAVYVPIDQGNPVKRVGAIASNCGISAIVTNQKKLASLQQVLPNLAPIECAVLTEGDKSQFSGKALRKVAHWQDVLQAPVSYLPPNDLTENDLAYILYTSGSTGTPKGVMVSHRASLNFVNWACECFHVRSSDRVSSHAPLHFDLSIFDIFATIKAGATAIAIPESLSVFPVNLAKFIAEQEINIWYSVPSVLIGLVLHGFLQQNQFPHLRAVLFAGEVFPLKYCRQLMTLVPQAKYYNLYGPTETNVCTYYPVDEIPAESVKTLPIGKACANNNVFAVNDRGEIAAPGEVGELYVEGRSLMNGYWGQIEETNSVFVPFGSSSIGAYKTGDFVKQDADGNYLFIGRCDRTIKSRGYRIDLGEIEAVLYSHPQVLEVAVVPIPREEIGCVIKAAIVPHNDTQLRASDLLHFVASHLPKYMIPGIIEIYSDLPKTSTGKIDLKLIERNGK